MAATTESASAYPIRSVDRVCDILDALANSDGGVSLTEVAAATSLPKSSAFRYLSALEARHYAERDADSSTYRLGPAFRPQHTRGIERLVELARPVLEQVRDATGETANLGLLDGTMIVHRMVIESPHSMRLAARVGERGYVHATALGKAICAGLPEDRVRAILNAVGMPRFTAATILDQDEYFAELGKVREQGYALDDQENQDEGRCLAVAIPRLTFPAGLSLSAPISRFEPEDVPAVARRLRKAAAGLGKKLAG
ncbi:IclR family transcriptional regulator [Kribbella sp.]|uniref:IclR family transcriptional regulator n=1 Tax=Kribbella sp. TaxID=1871183 RepID=UPI002D4AEBF0|nr:IclR family transcriptional regulator [Kribbella sp.]HZX07806.1 IclR family transcriptional regulator [Kribbella sp.]